MHALRAKLRSMSAEEAARLKAELGAPAGRTANRTAIRILPPFTITGGRAEPEGGMMVRGAACLGVFRTLRTLRYRTVFWLPLRPSHRAGELVHIPCERMSSPTSDRAEDIMPLHIFEVMYFRGNLLLT
jgi:hypothetical protein